MTAVVALALVAAAGVWSARRHAPSPPPIPTPVAATAAVPTGPVNFNEHVAPILFRHCTPCHRPGQPAPFTLLSFHDAESRAQDLVDAVTARRMPPWLADPACGPFANARLLNPDEITTLTRWVATGQPEGEPSRRPAPPVFTPGWRRGVPDLVVSPAAAFRLEPSPTDTYQNLVVAIPRDRPRYVRAVEFSPGALGLIHHAFLKFDRGGRSRRRAVESGGAGFPGLHLPPGAFSPDTQFLSWQPGRGPAEVPPGMSWRLEPGTDLVLQLHLPATRRAADVRPSVAFYFTDEPPTRLGYKVRLTSFTFALPAGVTNHPVREEFTVPIATTLVALLPHAHRLARRVRVTATPPGGAPRTVLEIPRWDFEWQTEYQLRPEIPLPAKTKLAVEFQYDNPGARPVGYGPNTSDEMAELWVLLALDSERDRDRLIQAELPRVIRDTLAYNEFQLRTNPRDWRARLEIGKARLTGGDPRAALGEFQRATALSAEEAEPHYYAGQALRELDRNVEAAISFREALRRDPKNGPAHGNLGLIYLEERRPAEAAECFRRALEIDPTDALARDGLVEAEAAGRGK